MRTLTSVLNPLAMIAMVGSVPLFISACGEASDDAVSQVTATGGGGSVSPGVSDSTGGTTPAPGVVNTGGVRPASGGSANSGGSPLVTGGSANAGGASPASGGSASNGGTTSAGGSNSGGEAPAGGAVTSGGAVSSGGMPATGGSANSIPPIGAGKMLSREGNPVRRVFDKYQALTGKADSVLSFQLDNGGWPKNTNYGGTGKGGSGKGTFDNDATTVEMTVMADAYKKTGEAKYLESARKAMDFILEAQYPNGGWPQYYPLKGGYHDHVTFNDDAMSRTLTVLQFAMEEMPPLDGDVFTPDQRAKIPQAIAGGVDYILKAQYVQNGVKTVWCAQHDKDTYAPAHARSYEWPTLSGSESVEIIAFLMTQPQTPEIEAAVKAAVAWFDSPDTYLQDYTYSGKFVKKAGSRAWARFYDLETNLPAFSNYEEPLYVGLDQQDKKKSGYSWGGGWGETIIKFAKSVGY